MLKTCIKKSDPCLCVYYLLTNLISFYFITITDHHLTGVIVIKSDSNSTKITKKLLKLIENS